MVISAGWVSERVGARVMVDFISATGTRESMGVERCWAWVVGERRVESPGGWLAGRTSVGRVDRRGVCGLSGDDGVGEGESEEESESDEVVDEMHVDSLGVNVRLRFSLCCLLMRVDRS